MRGAARDFLRSGVVAAWLAACASSGTPAGSPPRPASSPIPAARIPIEAIAKTCVLVASCAHPHDPPAWREPAACVDRLVARDAKPRVTACLERAKTCGDVDACLHGAVDVRAAEYCRAHPGAAGGCDGGRSVVCAVDESEESVSVDCAALGAVCGPAPSGAAAGSEATKALGCRSADLCPVGSNGSRCDGARAVIRCENGILDRATCDDGESCVSHEDADGEKQAVCAPPPTPGAAVSKRCDHPGKSHCTGTTLVECVALGHFGVERDVECRDQGLTCSESAGRARCVFPSGAPAAEACAAGTPARCATPETLAVCAAGKTVQVKCSDVGLGACDASARGPNALCREK